MKQTTEDSLRGTLQTLQGSLDKWLFCYQNTPHTSIGRQRYQNMLEIGKEEDEFYCWVPGEVLEVVGQNTYQMCGSAIQTIYAEVSWEVWKQAGEKLVTQPEEKQENQPRGPDNRRKSLAPITTRQEADQSHKAKPRTRSMDRMEREEFDDEGGFSGFRRLSQEQMGETLEDYQKLERARDQ
ncbi:hypothetical protein PR048_032462 [Dryococelus australis]|uniref:Uncharacterized protein n=1 Tax=Dryococelus australis TaxID=614101 RepID=A0ABQ9G297_9NEOP|nr:hypothetical protein PR048_032462 [Dryococelus australis]